MRQFHLDFTAPDFLSQVVRVFPALKGPQRQKSLSQAVREMACQVPWGHYANVLAGIKDPAGLLYYLRATIQFGWRPNILLNQGKAGAHGRSQPKGKTHNFPVALPGPPAEQAEEALKSSYNLEFLGISREVKQRELEKGGPMTRKKTPVHIRVDERNHVEKPLLDQLAGLGWEILDLDGAQRPLDSHRQNRTRFRGLHRQVYNANHKPRFWNILRSQVPTMEKAKAWLKEHGQILEENT